MSTDLDAFRAKFRVEELGILKFTHWTWSVRAMQTTLGASILSLNVPASRWADASPAAMAELHTVINTVETRLKKRFDYDRINYLMLMMVDPHVHFHILPRYQTSRTFAGREWVDRTWPKPPEIVGETATDEVLLAIKKLIATD